MKSIRAALVGCGSRGTAHALAARDGGAICLKYACDVNAERAESMAVEWGLKPTTDYREVLDDSEVEAIIIASDLGSHIRLAQDGLAAGKHLILEKPLSDDIAKARSLVKQAEESGVVAYVSFQLRFSNQLVAIKDVLPELDPVQIFFGRSRGMLKSQFLNPAPFCGILDVCAHDFDLVSWFMGCPPLAVTAVMRRNTFTRNTGALDVISALIDFGDGRSANLVSTIGAAEIGMKCDIAGAGGNLTLTREGNLQGVRFAEFASHGKKTPLDFGSLAEQNGDVELQRAFQKEIHEGLISQAARFSDGLNSLLLSSAVLKSMEKKRRVALDEL